MEFRLKKTAVTLLAATVCAGAYAQTLLSLNDAILIAQKESYAAKSASLTYMSNYWSYRQYKANRLPSLNLSGTLFNYNRSIVEVRNSETGRVSYVDNNSIYNNASVYISQNLPWADGKLELHSTLSRLDQFDYDSKTYNSMPMLLSYSQPLRRYSSMMWDKKIKPLQFEQAKRSYLETMQAITINVTTLYFNALSAQSDVEQSRAKHKDLATLYAKTEKRLALGLVTKDELLQLELALLNAKMAISYNELALENHLFNLFSYLRITDYKGVQLVQPGSLPDIVMNVDDVISKAYSNSSHPVQQRIALLNAEQNLAATKATNGLQVTLQAQVGLTQTAGNLDAVYRNLKDNEVVYLTFSLPIYDWGLGRGRTRMAKAQLELARTQAGQSDLEFVQDIRTKVIGFNSQAEQCRISKRALEIAEETYLMAYKRYENGAMTVTDFNTANNELESARSQYLSQLYTYWYNYYSIQRLTLFDYIRNTELNCDFDKMIN